MLRFVWMLLAVALAAGWSGADFSTHAAPRLFAFDEATGAGEKAEPTLEQDGLGSKVAEFVSVDKVELRGRFFPGARGKEAPCVLMLHALGENSSNKEWQGLAKRLQEKGFAVLTFDFRGHGDSTIVQPGITSQKPQLAVRGFWDEQLNQQGVKGFSPNKPRPTEIKYEQFNTSYYTVLANDIAAAKAYLDDADCNSSITVVIGAKDGATLGAIWLNSEWHRYRYLAPAPGYPQGGIDRQNPEGQAIAGAAWLSLGSSLGTAKNVLSMQSILDWPARQFRTPVLFLYSKGDDKAAQLSKNCEKYIVGKETKKFPNTLAFAVDNAEKLSGKELLLDSLPTSGKIVEFVEAVMPKAPPAKQRPRGMDDTYMWEWYVAGTQTASAVAKKSGSKLPEFSGYKTWAK
jgi:hypothetical protein